MIISQLSKVKPIEKIQIKIFKESENPKKKKKDKETGGNQLGSVELKLKEISGDWYVKHHISEISSQFKPSIIISMKIYFFAANTFH